MPMLDAMRLIILHCDIIRHAVLCFYYTVTQLKIDSCDWHYFLFLAQQIVYELSANAAFFSAVPRYNVVA